MTLGQPLVEYSLYLNSPSGLRLRTINDYLGFSLGKGVSSIGALSLVLPGYYDDGALQDDSVLEVWRSINGVPSLLFDTVWFLRQRVRRGKSNEPNTVTVTAYDPLYLLGSPSGNVGRNVAYNANNLTYTLLLGAADDLCKQVVRQNAGSLALDTARDLSAYLDVQANFGLGATIKKEFSRRNVLATLQEFAQSSIQAGTYIGFDIVCTQAPGTGSFKLEFQTFVQQRGADHRVGSANPILLGPDFGNLDNWELNNDITEEVTFVYAGGQSVGDIQAIATSQNTARMGVSPFNRREVFVSASGDGDAVALQDEADAALRQARVNKTLSGDLINTSGAFFGKHWGYGDYLTAQVLGQSFNCRADQIQIDFNQKDGERIQPTLRFDNV